MIEGWGVEFIFDGKRRKFNAAIADMATAERLILTRFPGTGRILLQPFKSGECERLALSVGQIVETAQ